MVRSWNAMDERGKQGFRDLLVDVLKPCSALIDGTSTEEATTHLSNVIGNLETHASSVTYQANRPSPNTPSNQTPWMGLESKAAQSPTHPNSTLVGLDIISPPFDQKSPQMGPKSTL